MALSQLQCLDNNNVNWRSSEAKPEFYYSEEQRLALEALVSTGPDTYLEVVKKENIRDFLSELELGKIAGRAEPFDPDSSHPKKSTEKTESEGEPEPNEDEENHSLEYWPDRSDCSIPELDLGWPDTVAYRGVTRATVYMQPPIDGHPHIKEVVRKMITNAQRVIALVMDHFTDVDIFKDMLEAGFKRKISVYIILNESDVKYFLQMCDKAQMHKGHLKNLRVRTVGGTEFYTRFSTKFKGSLGQKFMFVDGDKAMCGSYSFTWSAARIDRNLITVLSGQVVESFDRQFQELYLISKGVSLKNVPLIDEPEPEPVYQPAPLSAGQTEAIAKKLINPKYALVNVKTASEASKNSKQDADAAKKLPVKLRVPAQDHPYEHPVHPALQDLERANMFEYLPTWVEPDPEPGSEILGYINIIDPSIKNAQPSQMNRIKICDTSQATAQYLQQTKELERQKQEMLEEENKKKNKLTRQSSRNREPVPEILSSKHASQEHRSKDLSKQANQEPSPGKQSPLKQASQEPVLEPNHVKKRLSRQGSQEPVPEPSHGKQRLARQSSQEPVPEPSHGKQRLSRQGSREPVPEQSHGKQRQASQGQESEHGKGKPTKQGSQDLGYDPSQSNGISSLEQEFEAVHDELWSPGHSPSTENISQLNEDLAAQDVTSDSDPSKVREGFGDLAGSHHLVSHKPPPVPKPRTVPVTDFISLKNALNAKSTGTPTPTEDIPPPFVNGVDETDAKQIDIVIDSGLETQDDPDHSDPTIYPRYTGEYSSSGSGSLPQSNSSSLSEEYYPSNSLHRRSSDRIPNGERPPPRRKLSDGLISRGSFVSPLISQTLKDMRAMENEKRRSALEEELKRVITTSQPLQGKDRIYSMEPTQDKPVYQFTPNGPIGFERFSTQRGARNPSNARGKKEGGMDSTGPYRQLNQRRSEGQGARPGLWSSGSKDYSAGHTSPLSQSPVPSPDNASTPFGIPYSKLSQAKHLKNKLGTTNMDSRRRSHGPPGHKDL